MLAFYVNPYLLLFGRLSCIERLSDYHLHMLY